MSATLVDRGVAGVLEQILETDPNTVFIVHPNESLIRHVVDALEPSDTSIRINLIASEGILKEVMDDFIVASKTADLVTNDVLSLRILDGEADNAMLVTDDQVIALLTVGDRLAGLSTDRQEFVDHVLDTYEGRWEHASPFSLRTPPLTVVHDTLSSEIGDDVRADFAAVLATLDTARGNGDGLDEVTISLLVAAKNEALLYDISKWGEDIGIASKATFSRTKTRLEDQGLIDTEKVPIEVGRPRLRLKLAEGALRDAPADQLATEAINLLA